MKKRLVIKDEKGNFAVSNMTFMKDKNEIDICTLTGKRTGFTTYGNNTELAFAELNKLQSFADKYNLNKTFTLLEIDVDSIPKGKLIIEEIEIASKVA